MTSFYGEYLIERIMKNFILLKYSNLYLVTF